MQIEGTELKLTFLGVPQIQIKQQELSEQITGKTLALFIYLAVTNRTHSREQLADFLWSELDKQQARKNLRYVLPALRQQLQDYLLVSPQSLAFRPTTPYWMDVEILRSTLANLNATNTNAQIDPLQAQRVQQALDLYQGEFLAGFTVRNGPTFEEWVNTERANLHTLTLQGFETLATHYYHQENCSAGLTTTQRLLALEPWHEAAHRLQMRLLLLQGQRCAALEQYEQLQQLLDAELCATPEPETTALYQQILGGKQTTATTHFRLMVKQQEALRFQAEGETSLLLPQLADASPLAVQAEPLPESELLADLISDTVLENRPRTPKHNLPGQLTPFIGREREVAEISRDLLDFDHRLITLVGEGGTGKTRLALAVAERVLPYFADGVWFIALASLTANPETSTLEMNERLASAIATGMQLKFSGEATLSAQLLMQLRDKHAFIILDNFEHLLESADFIWEMLRHAADLKILVTSRHILNFQAEYIWRVDGLPVPAENADGEQFSTEQLLHYDSIALFVERAKRVMHGFYLNAENQAEVVRICQFVQGLPLGAELAAALTRHYTCAEIADALAENYTFLATQQRDLPPRHRSIQATLAYSWSFLTDEEKQVASLCSIFRGSFSVDAAQSVIKAARPMLAALEEHSLLRLEKPGRYVMHELVRQYAEDQLQLVPQETAPLRARYRSYHAKFLQDRNELLVHDQHTHQEVRTDLDDLRQFWQWAIADKDLASLGAASDGLFRFYYLSGMYGEGESSARDVVVGLRGLLADAHQQATPQQADPQQAAAVEYQLARSLLTHARFCERLGQLETALQINQEGIQLTQKLGATELEVRGYLGLAIIAQIRHDQETLRSMGEKMLALVQTGRIPFHEGLRVQAYALKHLGVYWLFSGDYQQASACFCQALPMVRQIDDRELETVLVNNLGVVHSTLGNFSQALQNYQQACTISLTMGEQHGQGLALINLAETYYILGNWQQAKSYAQEAYTLYHTTGHPLYEAKALVRLGRIAHAVGDEETADVHLKQALSLAERDRLQPVFPECLTDLGHVGVARNCLEEAKQSYQQALAGWQQQKEVNAGLVAQAGLALVALRQQDPLAAQAQVEAILATLADIQRNRQLNAIYDPIFIYWVSYQVLRANQDARAQPLLQRAAELVQAYAERIDHACLRQSFLANVLVNREILAWINNGQPSY